VTLQELRTQLGDSQAAVQRFESEHKRLTKSHANTQDTVEQHKNEGERLQNVISEMKAKHETEYTHHRKMAEKSDLQDKVNILKANASRALRSGSRFDSPLTPGGPETNDFLTPAGHDNDADIFGDPRKRLHQSKESGLFPPDDLGSDFADSPDASPIRKPFLAANHPTNEIEALQQRLAHAQRQINTLKGSLNHEKQLRMRLEWSPGAANLLDEDEEEQEEDYVDETTAAEAKRVTKRSTTPFKVGARRGRGRGRGGREAPALSKGSVWQPIVPHPNSAMTSRLWTTRLPSSSCHPDSLQPTGRSVAILRHQPRARPRRRARRPSRTHFSLDLSFTHGLCPVVALAWMVWTSFCQRSASHSIQWIIIYTQPATPNCPRSFRMRWQRGPSIKRRCAVQGGSTTFHRGCSGNACYGIGRHGLVTSEKRRPLSAAQQRGESEEDSDDGEYIRVKKVEKVEFGYQTEFVEEEKTVVLPEPPVVVPAVVEPVAPVVVHAEIGVQSEPEPKPEPIPSPKVVTTDVATDRVRTCGRRVGVRNGDSASYTRAHTSPVSCSR
jgi:hypothetical protein